MMTSPNLDNLVKIGKLKKEAVSQTEFDGLVKSGHARLSDARTAKLSLESRFDLAYNASHALALAALRWHGYRSENRYLVFQCLQETLGLRPEQWRVLALCHERCNVAEYEGHLDVEERLVTDLIQVADVVFHTRSPCLGKFHEYHDHRPKTLELLQRPARRRHELWRLPRIKSGAG